MRPLSHPAVGRGGRASAPSGCPITTTATGSDGHGRITIDVAHYWE